MIKFVKREVDGNAEEIHVFGLIRYARVGLISEMTILGCAIYQRVDSVRWLFGVRWTSHAA
jgi:hypothetical protein